LRSTATTERPASFKEDVSPATLTSLKTAKTSGSELAFVTIDSWTFSNGAPVASAWSSGFVSTPAGNVASRSEKVTFPAPAPPL
jgi:hypothetical protein